MIRTLLFARIAFVAMTAAFLASGCELTSVEDLGPVTLNDLQGIAPPVTNTPPPVVTNTPPVVTNTPPVVTNTPSLPTNPTIPANPAGTSAELWYFGFKSYDNTFRIRWPTYFATVGVGKGSYTTVNGQKAAFRSYDTDNGAKRPSYTMPGPKSRFSGTVTCILYSSSGKALGWFKARADATTQGRLP